MSGTVTITLSSDAPWLRTGDAVDFTDASGNVTESDMTVTVISPTSFTYSGSIPTGTRCKAHNAPGFWWYDVAPKGDFIFAQWGFNYRDIAIDDTTRYNQFHYHSMPQEVSSFMAITDCVPFNICNPSVMCISPNNDPLAEDPVDDFPTGTTYPFQPIIPDDRFGAKWQAVIQQVMDDIFWAAPPKPCPSASDGDPGDTSACTWDEDDGTCLADTCAGVGGAGAQYYPHRPQVEARAAVPLPWLPGDTAPALPTGIYIGYLTLDELDTSSSVNGNILTPPIAVGTANDPLYQPLPVNEMWAPWNLYFFEQQCVCATGRWATQYQGDGVIC
jgi:hypothetical protein